MQSILFAASTPKTFNPWVIASELGDTARGVALDITSNLYVVGDNGTNIFVAKYEPSGLLLWYRNLGTAGTTAVAQSVAVDASGNCYLVGYLLASFSYDIFVAKYDSSGVLQWQNKISDGGSYDQAYGVALDSSGNVYLVGAHAAGAFGGVFVAKYNSSGTLQWQQSLSGGYYDQGNAIALDSSANVYVVGYGGFGSNQILLAKYNSSGVLQWQRALSGSNNSYGVGVSVDPTGNVYVCGYSDAVSTSNFNGVLAKYNSSGTIQWQRNVDSTQNDYFYGIVADSNGNSYVVGATIAGGYARIFVAKYNTSGTLQWQRTLSSSSADNVGYGVTLNNAGNLYVCGNNLVGSTKKMLLAKLPADGTYTGTYGAFTYAASSLTSSVGALTSATSTLTTSTPTRTTASTSLTSTDSEDLYVVS